MNVGAREMLWVFSKDPANLCDIMGVEGVDVNPNLLCCKVFEDEGCSFDVMELF